MPFLSTEHLAEDVSLGLWLLDEEEDFFFKNYPCLRDLQEKMTTIGSKQRRLEKLAARALLFEMTNNPDLHFSHNDSGKPLLEGYHVSVSHTKGMVALMLSKTREVAVDVEYESDRVGGLPINLLMPMKRCLPMLISYWLGVPKRQYLSISLQIICCLMKSICSLLMWRNVV